MPDGLKIDGMAAVADPKHPVEVMRIPRLRLHPSAAGVQHCEIAGMRDTIAARVSASWIPAFVRRWAEGTSWEAKDREIKPNATIHPSVAERFSLPSVVQCDGAAPYRPAPLANHVDFRSRYATGTPATTGPMITSLAPNTVR